MIAVFRTITDIDEAVMGDLFIIEHQELPKKKNELFEDHEIFFFDIVASICGMAFTKKSYFLKLQLNSVK